MLALLSSEQERGAAAALVNAGLTTLLVLATGIGFVLGHTLLCSRSYPKKVGEKGPKPEPDDDHGKPEGEWVEEPASSGCGPGHDGVPEEQLDEPRKPSRPQGEASATPTTDIGSAAGDESPCTPSTVTGPVADAKELARALARESRAAAAAEAAANCAAAIFMEALGPEQKSLNAQVRAIAREAFSDAAVQTHKGEKVAALVLGEEVVGYASYQLRAQLSSLNINKLAVPRARRRQGLGRCLLRHLIQLAKRPVQKSGRGGKGPAPLEVVCLSALPTAISFYKACGFKEEPGVKVPQDDDEELEEGQLYMEYRLRKKGRK